MQTIKDAFGAIDDVLRASLLCVVIPIGIVCFLIGLVMMFIALWLLGPAHYETHTKL